MELSNYAPVLIPTCNRYNHLKRCLESLEKCSGANNTDVYVAVDYPPSEKYIEGWERVTEYLRKKESGHKFHTFRVYYRDRNYGLGHRNSNIGVLIDDIRTNYDSFISTEDDNEFSPNFLEYMNMCLERFKNDDRIIKICGYNFDINMPPMYKNNFYISMRGCAWGTASWFNKRDLELQYYDLDYLRTIIRDDSSYYRLKQIYPRAITLLYGMLKSGKLHGDATWEICCALEDKYFILPTLSKVRNYGNDGSGWHSRKNNNIQNKFYLEQVIDNSETFEFTDDIFTYEPVNMRNNNYKVPTSLRSIYKSFVCNLDIWLLRHFNYMPKSKYI